MGKNEDRLIKLNKVFIESALDIVEFSESKQETLGRWSDNTPPSEGRTDKECVGFITKQEFSDSLNFVMDVILSDSNGPSLLRVRVIKVETNNTGTEIFNQVAIDFIIDSKAAVREIKKGDKFNIHDLVNILNNEELTISRVVLSDATGLDEEVDKRLGIRYDYDFAKDEVFLSSEKEPRKEKILQSQTVEEIKSITHKILVEVQKEMKSK